MNFSEDFIFIAIVWGIAGWGILTREEKYDGIGRMITAIIMLLTGIYCKL